MTTGEICGLSLQMIGKKTATCIAENVTITFKHECRSPTLTSRCDVISDVVCDKKYFH